MKQSKIKKLRRAGFRVGTVQDFLQLSAGEMALIELKIRLIDRLKSARHSAGISQHQLAKLISSSQSRVAKMEAGSSDVSLDLICKSLFALGVSRRDVGRTIASKRAA